jgi:uncharacterized protein YjbJ (UPF0337 family)
MDWNRVEGNWKEFQGKVKEKWGKLTDDDLTAISGKREQLEGRLQQRYGFAKDQVRKDVDSWFSSGPNLTLRFAWGFPEELACASLGYARANEDPVEPSRP